MPPSAGIDADATTGDPPTDAARRYYLWTIGCQMNQADSRRLAEALEARGYAASRRPEDADVLILNTCVVRQSAEDKVVGRLSSLEPLARDPEHRRILLVMGCIVGDAVELSARFRDVDGFFAPSDVQGLLSYLDGRHGEGQLSGPLRAVQVSEMVPISYGCDHHCTYCIITERRGPQQSRPLSDILAEARDLVSRGAREITLLGQNVDAYGSDLDDGVDLADVLAAVHEIPGLLRLRFLTSHPREMSQRIIDAAAQLGKVCPSWELPVQAGDDAVLRRMARGYTIDRYRDVVARIRAAIPGAAINTDIIVGFCGETEEQFERTLELARELRFDQVHIAAYSVRTGTAAATWPDDVPPEEKERRRLALESLQTEITGEINARLRGRTVEILVEDRQRGRWRGRTASNKLVFFDDPADWRGRLARVRITWTGPWSMIGDVETDDGH
ncbi:MAG: tRNA (N6-isopentenyl adenosine(37)-C2)-methylthiotransferase MiaB [Chloroflexi bacterium]|nr:tRNA (N6-isopentenyl adenosine(37)-C2)-methylthiotransferase MiaB [Chloroflexota bacterium]